MKKTAKLTIMVAGSAMALAGVATAVAVGGTTRPPDAAAPPGAARAQRVADINPTAAPALPNLHTVTVKVKNESALFTPHICLKGGLNSNVCTGDLSRGAAPGQATDSFADGAQNAEVDVLATRDNIEANSLDKLPAVTSDATYCYLVQDEFGNVYSFERTDCTGF